MLQYKITEEDIYVTTTCTITDISETVRACLYIFYSSFQASVFIFNSLFSTKQNYKFQILVNLLFYMSLNKLVVGGCVNCPVENISEKMKAEYVI